MTTKTWNGSIDNFNVAADWSPAGVPASNDTAIISSGTVTVSTPLSGVTIQLVQAAGSTTAATLAFINTTLDSSNMLSVTNNNSYNSAAAATVSVSGTLIAGGTGSFYGSKIVFSISSGSTLINNGLLDFFSSSLVTNGGGLLRNSGTISIVNPGNQSLAPVLSDAIDGAGSIALGKYASLEIGSSIGSGQTIIMNDGSSGNETLQLDQVGTFGATVSGFSSSDLISAIVSSSYTGYTYTSTSSSAGALNLFAGTTLLGSIALSGSYAASSFTLNPVSLGGGTTNLQITTSAVNQVTAGLPSGYQNGGNGTTTGSTVGAVYRFFDKSYGTHFFTADIGERNTILATRTDLVAENNGFGSVQQSNTGATAVYRFFDKILGTHFFTADAGERDAVAASRPDLSYEPGATFYEHATQQNGDVTVYRFFDSQFGTHFYTGDVNEYKGLTTPGASTYRANLTSEGVAFYAPPGTFK